MIVPYRVSFAFILLISAVLVGCENEQFKINKLNLVWSKAQHQLGPGKLKDLKNDLTKHEHDEVSLKKMKAHNQDKDGLFEATIRKKLHSIMAKYGLERYYDDVHPQVDAQRAPEANPMSSTTTKRLGQDHHAFRDTRLDKLWKKAEKAGFTQEQLMVLHEEFQHQQDKLADHYETMNMIEEEVEARMKEENDSENSIEGKNKRDGRKSSSTKETEAEKRARLENNIHQSLKEKYKDIKKDINELHKKIVNGRIADDGEPFEFEIVNDLWTSAQQSNFTISELESLKEELGHYETRIKKLKHFQNQLERNKVSSKRDYSESDKETKHIEKKVKELSHKVEKTHKTIENMINSKREEL